MTGGQAAALAALGAFHGINPGMGWLFAVARGLQERSRAALAASLPAVAAGHAASVAVVAVAVTITGSVVASRTLAIGGGSLLVAFGLWRLLSRRHFRWVGMRLSLWQLAAWSFLMSSVHGAGLMLLPVLAGSQGGHGHAAHQQGSDLGRTLAGATLDGLGATAVHTLAMLAVAGGVAVLVYEVVGLTVLRRVWINLDWVWAIALIGAGATTLLLR
ncbi:MAG: hypothetical protein GEV03_18630 [Streptosporangiales bacterium]|nr:hypothetical protein [Streptosporangiales bacterium]